MTVSSVCVGFDEVCEALLDGLKIATDVKKKNGGFHGIFFIAVGLSETSPQSGKEGLHLLGFFSVCYLHLNAWEGGRDRVG